ncbi:hypothetical protein [Shimazuella alba]|uniref:Uncharacterized protein n=1 Tax=Shimazuella alba TaxID=2690964 RepID=A0A6I4VRL5_9BACL|nr:hypothetical protein [Shimazuella alba]MXQ54297.1 hypothetical protein [Shimazuella alba]
MSWEDDFRKIENLMGRELTTEEVEWLQGIVKNLPLVEGVFDEEFRREILETISNNHSHQNLMDEGMLEWIQFLLTMQKGTTDAGD